MSVLRSTRLLLSATRFTEKSSNSNVTFYRTISVLGNTGPVPRLVKPRSCQCRLAENVNIPRGNTNHLHSLKSGLDCRLATFTNSSRLYSNNAGPTVFTINELKEEIKSDKLLLLDVRNPKETMSTGVIANAEKVPLPILSNGFQLDKDDFETEFGFPKPSADDYMAVYCLAGIRAKTAMTILHELGYTNVHIYPGGWGEWADSHPGLKKNADGVPVKDQ